MICRCPRPRRLLVARAGAGPAKQGLEELGLVEDMLRRESVHGFVVVPDVAEGAELSHFGVSWKEVGRVAKSTWQ